MTDGAWETARAALDGKASYSEQSLSLVELSQRLQIEPSALEGMIAFWVRKGRLRDTAVLGCGGSSAGPRMITLSD